LTGQRDSFQSGERRIGFHGVAKDRKIENGRIKPAPPVQPSLFIPADPIQALLKKLKIDQLTPLEAINVLDELKKRRIKMNERANFEHECSKPE
jgi:hypothetical protein